MTEDRTGSAFDDLMGTELLETTATSVRARLVITTEHLQPGGAVHGGVYATLAETVASIGASLATQAAGTGIAAVGLDNHTSFLRSVHEGAVLIAEATPRQTGRHIHAWTVSIREENDTRDVAIATVRLYVVRAPS